MESPYMAGGSTYLSLPKLPPGVKQFRVHNPLWWIHMLLQNYDLISEQFHKFSKAEELWNQKNYAKIS